MDSSGVHVQQLFRFDSALVDNVADKLQVPNLTEPGSDPEHKLWTHQDCVSTIVLKLKDDRHSMKQCSVVSRTFRFACRSRLYSSFEIRLNKGEILRVQNLYEIMSKNKDVIGYIRNLTLCGSLYSSDFDHDGGRDDLIGFLDFLLGELIRIAHETRNTGNLLSSIHDENNSSQPGLHILNIANIIWDSFEKQTQSLMIDLIKSISQPRALALPSCDRTDDDIFYCQCFNKCEIFHTIIGDRSGQSVNCGLRTTLLFHRFLKNQTNRKRKTTGCTGSHTRTQFCQIERFNEDLRELLFIPECPIDFSQVEELCIDRMEDIWSDESFMEILNVARRGPKSLIWLMGVEWKNFDQLVTASNFTPISISPVGKSELRLRSLSLGAALSRPLLSIGIDNAFPVLCSNLGIHHDEIEEVNLSYIAHDVAEESMNSITQVSIQARNEFSSLKALNLFPKLLKIHILVGLPTERLGNGSHRKNYIKRDI